MLSKFKMGPDKFLENRSVTRKYRTSERCKLTTTTVASAGMQEDWTTRSVWACKLSAE